jgi:hypothetical protein
MTANGYYVWGKYTSVAWFLNRNDAEECAKKMNYRGGINYIVVSA